MKKKTGENIQMQKCQKFHLDYSSMDLYLVKTFAKKLEKLCISDYFGLRSPGLTCYLNSILQVLFMTDDFREAVKRCYSEQLKSLDRHLGELFLTLERNMAETYNITKQLGIRDVYEQRDAAEYFEKILCHISPKASKIFRGELNHKTRCCKCNTTNNSKSFFWVLPLSMDDSNCKTYKLRQGLEDFFKVQRVSGENQMFCSCCNTKRDADINYEMTQSPDVLTLLLKRFSFDYKHNCYFKLQCIAEVVQTITLETCSYELYAVVHHCGDLTGGHYTADIKSFETGSWYCFNDNVVQSLKQQRFDKSKRSKTVYLLMYRKVSGPVRNTDLETSDILNENIRDKTERGHSPLKGESCRGGNSKLLNGQVLPHDAYKGANQRAELVRQPQKDADEEQQDYTCMNGRTSDAHLGSNTSDRVNNVNNRQYISTKRGTETHLPHRSPSRRSVESIRTETVSKQKEVSAAGGETRVNGVDKFNIKMFDDYVLSSVPSHKSPYRPSECNGSPCLCTKSNSFKKNEQKQC